MPRGAGAARVWIEGGVLGPVEAETARLVGEAESLDGVWLAAEAGADEPPRAADLGLAPWSSRAVLRRSSWRETPGGLEPRGAVRVKVLPLAEDDPHGERRVRSNERRGPWMATPPQTGDWTIDVRDVSTLAREPAPGDGRPEVLVLAPFLARGGAEHTLYETMRCLTDRYRFSIATLAPHVAARGDRRADFRELAPRLYPLGDLVHPAAMPGILVSLLRSTGARLVYNANGTTLFYDFAPRWRDEVPGVAVVDHLYDHEVGYVDRYVAGLPEGVDACIAENHRIAEHLAGERAIPVDRVPVVWPCGRAPGDLPDPDERDAIRTRVREELGLAPDDVVFLAAARLHDQKRPLDFVELARRFAGTPGVRFLWAGDGDRGEDFRAALAAAPEAPIEWLGMRRDVPDLLLAADVGCLVSDYEGLPVFLLESFQLGRPFLGTDVGDLGRVLRETGGGLVVDRPGDLEGLEAAVRKLLDPDTRRELARRATAAADRFSPSSCADRYDAVFRALLERNGAGA